MCDDDMATVLQVSNVMYCSQVFSNTVSMEILGFEQLQDEELLTVEGMIIIFTPNLLKVNSKKRNLFTASFICIVF